MSSQWFISVNQEGNSLKEKALDLLEKIEVHPADMKKQMADWLNNMHDWNISRQIFWGHSIPFSIN
jgi:valyl-tRNA synthetase